MKEPVHRLNLLMVFFFFGILLAACGNAPIEVRINPTVAISLTATGTHTLAVTTTPTSMPTYLQENTPTPQKKEISSTNTPAPISTPTITPTFSAVGWKTAPVIPEYSKRSLEIYRRGLAAGNNPQAFSKVGDCESTPGWFLGDFEKDSKSYDLGMYANLSEVIAYFKGSFARESIAVRRGANASSILTPLWADPKACQKNESPLACEYRINRPAIALINLGTNDVWQAEKFESQLRQIIEQSIALGVVPVLSTKADNLEGDHRINQLIARLAYEYDIPLWNFWLAVQGLPGKGLQDDGAHLTWAPNFFDAANLTRAWPVRNLTALQTLDKFMRSVKE